MLTITVDGVEREATAKEEADILAVQAAIAPTLDPLTMPIPADILWVAAQDLLGITKYGVMASVSADTSLSEEAKMDALVNLLSRNNYLRNDQNVIRLSALMGYPPEQMDSLWVFVRENYV